MTKSLAKIANAKNKNVENALQAAYPSGWILTILIFCIGSFMRGTSSFAYIPCGTAAAEGIELGCCKLAYIKARAMTAA